MSNLKEAKGKILCSLWISISQDVQLSLHFIQRNIHSTNMLTSQKTPEIKVYKTLQTEGCMRLLSKNSLIWILIKFLSTALSLIFSIITLISIKLNFTIINMTLYYLIFFLLNIPFWYIGNLLLFSFILKLYNSCLFYIFICICVFFTIYKKILNFVFFK